MPRFSRSSRTSVGLSWFVFLKSDRRIARPNLISRRGARDFRLSARSRLDEVHRSHTAQVVRVAQKFSAWGLQTDLAAVAAHPAATRFARLGFTWSVLLTGTAIVVDAVVVLTQHRQIGRFRMPAVFVGIDMVDLAPIGRDIAVGPWADEVLGHSQGA